MLAASVSVQQTVFTRYDTNFVIFRNAAQHLRAGLDLYASYPLQHADIYKYSPTFALAFVPFALLPIAVAHALWMLLCSVCVWAALASLYDDKRLGIAWVIVAGSLLLDLQRAQTNALVAALMIFSMAASQRGQVWRASFQVAAGTAVKLFPLVAAIGWIWQPAKLRALLVGGIAGGVLIAAPLFVTPFDTLVAQYHSWFARETLDAAEGVGACWHCATGSVSGSDLYGGIMFHARLLAPTLPHWPVQLAGLAILLLPAALCRADWSAPTFHRRMLASTLLFTVLFNHQAESPSFILALCGIAIWYCEGTRTRWHTLTLLVTVAIVSYGTSDLIPHDMRTSLMIPYRLRTLPCFAIWLLLQSEMLGVRRGTALQRSEVDQSHASGGPVRA